MAGLVSKELQRKRACRPQPPFSLGVLVEEGETRETALEASGSISWGVGLFYHYRSGRFNNTEHTNYDFDSDGIQDTSANFFHRREIK